MNPQDLEKMLLNEVFPILQENLEVFTSQLLTINQLPLVLTNEDLKKLFQISDSTLNRLLKLADFPACWYGIRGHYLRDEVLDWLKQRDYTDFIDQRKLLRSL